MGKLPYTKRLKKELTLPSEKTGPVVLDLFAGCGGMSLGFEAAGFFTIGYEVDEDCCATYRHNLRSHCHQICLKPGQELSEHASVVIGGPPCQPFSVNGHQQGNKDKRDGIPTFLWAVRRYKPRIVLMENVRGMLYRNFLYFEQLVQQLKELGYLVEWKLLNAVHFGVPQNRERLFVIAYLGTWEFPVPTHLNSPVTAGAALEDLAHTIPKDAKFLTPSMDEYVARYEAKSKCINPRDLHLDRPSRTVTCRNLNGATGDMLRIRLEDGRRRRLTVREGARLQGFPDWFEFIGTEASQFNQIGNAVPPLLGKALALAMRKHLNCQPRLTGSNCGTISRMRSRKSLRLSLAKNC